MFVIRIRRFPHSLPLFLANRLLSSSTTPLFYRNHDVYTCEPPPPPPENPYPEYPEFPVRRKGKEKPLYRPPSSLDRAGKSPLRSKLPFDFRYSYTEICPLVRPIGLREPKYSPFGPERLDREWTGICAPAMNPEVTSGMEDPKLGEKRKMMREMILGDPLTVAEKRFIVEQSDRRKTRRQVNLGRDGLTHNMLNDIRNNWKHVEAIRIKCLGVATADMNNVCTQLEDKTSGKIIFRHGGKIILYRGRNYDPRRRPVIPLMLWKPHDPIYPKLMKRTIEGLSIVETQNMRQRGLIIPALTKLAKNGYYGTLAHMVRRAFLTDELVRIDCEGLERSDYKKIGCKLRYLVPCILVTFKNDQIVVWRGKDYRLPSTELVACADDEEDSDGSSEPEFYSGDDE